MFNNPFAAASTSFAPTEANESWNLETDEDKVS